MLLEIDHHSGVPIYRQVMRQVRRMILTGQLRAGEQLETVRQLAERVNVNPMTVSKAYAFLEAEGLLDRRRGVGLFVAETQNEGHDAVRSELVGELVDKAVFAGKQFGMSEAEITRLFKGSCAKHGYADRRKTDE